MRKRVIGAVIAVILVGWAAGLRGEAPSGTLVICGGGKLPETVMKRFVELGGAEPVLVVIPTASELESSSDPAKVRPAWEARGVRDITVLHTRSRDTAESEEFVKPLRRANLVWIGGGNQSRVIDAYAGTRTHAELRALLARGGAIGGTSAGAAVMSEVMIAGGTEEPRMSKGLGFVTRAIVDQHFLARKRTPRLLAAMKLHPTLTGIGIDEGGAIEVTADSFRSIGAGDVLLFHPDGRRETIKPGASCAMGLY